MAKNLPAFTIIAALPEDAPRLTQIAFDSKAFWGYPDHWLKLWRSYLEITADSLRTDIVFKAIDEKGAILGFYRLSKIEGGMHLTAFWIAPPFIRMGLGRALYAHMLEIAKNLGVSHIEWECDPLSSPFYEKMGASYVGTKTYSMNGQEWTVPLMQVNLASDDKSFNY